MTGFIEALQFLTVIHYKKDKGVTDSQKLRYAKIYFPLIGALLGLVLIVIYKFIAPIFPEPLLSLFLVLTLILLTGALHLDGLADACDALGGGKNKEEILNIMRDSHKGTFGVLGLIIVVLFKITLLSLITPFFKTFGLFLMTTLSRYSMNIALSFFPYARKEGKAKIFFEHRRIIEFLLPTLITVILLGLTLNPLSVFLLLLVIAFTLIMTLAIQGKIDGVTGDILGALCELNEIIVLLSIFILTKFYP